jgi:predicted nucleotidyltransferase
MRVDILMGVPGVAFEPAWQRRVEVDFDGLLVKFIAREDLIAAKKASGRPQDLIDAELLSRPDDG